MQRVFALASWTRETDSLHGAHASIAYSSRLRRQHLVNIQMHACDTVRSVRSYPHDRLGS